MKETIETSKGRFVVKHYETWSELIIDANYYKLKLDVNIFKLSKITEEQASSIVEMTWINNDERLCKYKNYDINGNGSFSSSVESLHSLLESQGIEITNNTYIFKV